MRALSIKKKHFNTQTIACLLLYYTLFVGFFIFNFHMPESLLYFGDVLNVLLLMLCLRRILKTIKKQPLRRFIIFIALSMFVGLVSAMMNGLDFLLVLWSFRNWGRAISFFLACCCVLDEKSVKNVITFSKKLFHVNTVVILLQFVLFHSFYNQDALNGLFGRNTSSVNVTFLMIMLSIVLSEYFIKKIKFKTLIIYLLEYNIICILAELRALILFEIIFIAMYALINFKGSVKQLSKYVILIIVAVIGAAMAANYLTRLYPEFAGFLSIKGILSSANSEHGYGLSGYIDRLNYIPVISKFLFKGNAFKIACGIGMGNAEYSAVSWLCSPFYAAYGETFNYLRFSSSMLYLETGILGLVMFLSAYVSLFFHTVKKVRSRGQSMLLFYYEIGMGFIATIIVFIFYNNLQRTDASFILAFFAAMPFAIARRTRNNMCLLLDSNMRIKYE